MPTPDDIINWSPEEMRAWLATRPSPERFHWLTLAEGAAMAANSPGEFEPTRREALGEIAIYAFDMAAREDEELRKGNLLSEIVLRAGLIGRLGAATGTVRDDKALIAIIGREIEQADALRDTIAQGPVEPLNTPRPLLRALRRIKSVFRAAEFFLAAREQELPERLSWWWSRRDRLP